MTISDSFPYIPGKTLKHPEPLGRFLPPLEDGMAAAWLAGHVQAGAWVLDPFGSSPRLAAEMARAGYRVVVAANNPVGRFQLEMNANPPLETEYKAALADLAVSPKGDERLETHLQALYQTQCANCGQQVPAQAFLWRKGEDVPYARIYECQACGEGGERPATAADEEHARKIATSAGLHRARVLERVVPLDDPDRQYVEEALNHYLPRQIDALATLINRLDGLQLTKERHRALTALLLSACDAANTLWPHPTERPRPKQLNIPTAFRENNVWLALEESVHLWADDKTPVPLVIWPQKLPESGGICVFEGRLKDLAAHLKEAPFQAVVTALPRPNQAFWTLSALWAGWLWGSEAVEPFRVALRRRRYDWDWHAEALQAALRYLFEVLSPEVPFFGFLPEPEPAFLTAALVATEASGFALQGLALRTQHDAVQLIWGRRQDLGLPDRKVGLNQVRNSIRRIASEWGEPVTYLRLHIAGLAALADAGGLIRPQQSVEQAVKQTQASLQQAVSNDHLMEHLDGSDQNLETGLWGLKSDGDESESLPDRVEVAVVQFLLNNPKCSFLDIQRALNPKFPGLLTPSKGIIRAVLNSYGAEQNGSWRLRDEDLPAHRRDDLEEMKQLIEAIGLRLDFSTRRMEDNLLAWEEKRKPIYFFHLSASALVGRIASQSQRLSGQNLLVLPGGRAGLAAYKQQRNPALREKLQGWRFVKFRLLRSLTDIPILTRQTWEEQINSDPIEQTRGQLMMF